MYPCPAKGMRNARYFYCLFCSIFSGCISLSLGGGYKTPPERPLSLDAYYSVGRTITSHSSEILQRDEAYTLERISVESGAGPITIDYFRRKEPSDSIVLVFPVLGGKNIIENYFADYFARSGFDAAVVHRSNEFKKPENVDHLEQILRLNIVRDRVALDFFEQEYGKKKFGTFGISRGAINVAMTAGVDSRLSHNVLALGGTDLVSIFRDAHQNRIEKYINTVVEMRGITREKFFADLRAQIKTDPKYLAQFLDAKHTLLVLAALDKTVPFKYGMKLRRQIGNPKTVVLLANHFTSLMFTQIASIAVPAIREFGVFPFDYVEGQAVEFYRSELNNQSTWWRNLPFKIVQFPINMLAELNELLFGTKVAEPIVVDDGVWK
jgi:hypothetical protein